MNIDDEVVLKIYKPTKTATQSGLGNTRFWYLKTKPDFYYIEPLMGWVGSKNPKKQIILKFSSLEQAISYVKKRNVKYIIEMPKSIRRLPKSYASNFIPK
ncbi:NADH dehydrogenase ubiquinone Fe-S protein 4 [Wolbachia endosymbiont of Dirofilaria (Dirofilaria) immitis]|uniref:NADH dehydrogenase ubiquinone Fe-S protein 4 n=1 Tax=Wolbachia endosymbiont of Dirofilaria (Dirofilaria) immitis TaxID=1812115 RepID=UPI001589C1AD|nr:NADH dehydrogenase ubiquinone Fe-S protein 4 [Wolbachia endosymbiont of Dirofilaria (Dirofilaria) immitis]QKX02333.1 oxidoreductase [Wolbachia endosymbiont of Dirofilaria (Dirofilaria) immitis]